MVSGKEPDLDKGPRLTLRYLDRTVPYVSDAGTQLRLPRFSAGDRSYLVATRDPDGILVAVSDKEVLLNEVLGLSPERLIHKLQDKESFIGALTILDEVATRELARVVAKGFRLTKPSQRVDLAREEGDTKNKSVKLYLEWLAKREK